MTMEKHGVSKDNHLLGLRDMEACLMQDMQRLMSNPGEKTAAERADLESRLQSVRAQISDLDNPPPEAA